MRVLSLLAALVAAPVVLLLLALGGNDSQEGSFFERATPDDAQDDEAAPTASPTPQPPPAPAAFEYTIQPGDTLSELAALFGLTLDELLQANPAADPTALAPGASISVPLVAAPAPVRSDGMTSIEQALRDAEREHALPPGLLLALAWQESGWQQDAVSPAGAVGVAQVLPSTAEWAQDTLVDEALDWRRSAEDNARMGAAYLRYLIDRADGDVWAALAAYHQGWRGVEVRGVTPETRSYVRNVLALLPRFQPGG